MILILFIKLALIDLITGEKVLTEIITKRRDNDFHFRPKGKNGVQNAICAPGVKMIGNHSKRWSRFKYIQSEVIFDPNIDLFDENIFFRI